MTARWMFAVLAALATLAGCGGKVVLDGVEGSGGGSSTSSTTTTSGTSEGPKTYGKSCMLPPDPATLTTCEGLNNLNLAGFQAACATAYCDPNGEIFTAECKGIHCVCVVGNQEACSCILNGKGDFCNGTPHCCPWGKAP